jgi:3-phenylpropionate/cinnamic acid dioxygenase small subunit
MGTEPSTAVADRQAIAELLASYAWAMADRDWDRWQEVFAPGAHVDYTTAGGVAGTPAEAAAWMGQTMPMFDVTLSQSSNVVVAFTDDDHATSRSLYSMMMRIPAGEGGEPTYMQASGWYHDQLVRTAAGWRIADRYEHLAYVKGA